MKTQNKGLQMLRFVKETSAAKSKVSQDGFQNGGPQRHCRRLKAEVMVESSTGNT